MIYVAFDNEKDYGAYNKIKEWRKENGDSFDFYDGYNFASEIDVTPDDILKQKIQENISKADIFLLLVGLGTKSMRRFVKWQIEFAILQKIPFIVLNLNNIRSVDYDRCPTILKSNLSIHISHNSKILEYTLSVWPDMFQNYVNNEKKGTFRFTNDVYKSLNIESYEDLY